MRFGIYRLSALLDDENLRNKTREAMQSFDCEHDASDVANYLRSEAEADESGGRCRTYLILDIDVFLTTDPKVVIVAYFTITQHSLDVAELVSSDAEQDAADYLLGGHAHEEDVASKRVHGYLIVQFAKNKSFQGSAKGFFQFAQTIIERASVLVGGQFIILDCHPESLVHYYEDFGFVCIGEYKNDDELTCYQMYKPISEGLDASFFGDAKIAP